MATDVNNQEESLAPHEDTNLLEGGSSPKYADKLRDAANKDKASLQEARKKKQEALEGKESHKAKGEESESENEGHHGAEKAEGEDSGTHSRQSLQSQQATVQFSSGSSIGGANASTSLSSLMGLYASSATLARAESGSALNVSAQSANLTSRSVFQASNTQGTGFLSEEGKVLKETLGAASGQSSESVGVKFNIDGSSAQVTHTTSGFQDALSGILSGISAQASEDGNDITAPPLLTVFSNVSGGSTFTQIFNANTVFPPPTIIFAYTNGIYSNVISNYLSSVNLPTASSYTYTFTPTSLPAGDELNLSATGDLTVAVESPVSILIDIDENGKEVLPVRIDAGPGVAVADSSTQTAPFIGNPVVGNSSTYSLGTVMTITGSEVVVGNAVTYSPTTADWDNGSLSLPGNVIYRHVFTETGNDITTIKVPTAPVYGNFETGFIDIPAQTSSGVDLSTTTLTLGGNVLDVFGTQYGVGGSLTVDYSSSTSSVINFNGNTLAGFGNYFGDFQTLTLDPAASLNSGVTETINFGPNQLYVDKAVGSILYPDIGTLDLDGTPHNLSITFSNNIVEGNEASDTFYGEIRQLGDLNNSTLYNGFLTGVTVNTTLQQQGIVSIDDANGNSITFGNDVYVGGGQNPDIPGVFAQDTYNFTLLGNTANLPIMEGNITLTDFNNTKSTLTSDILQIELTPDVFKQLDLSHNKIISGTDLDSFVSFTQTSAGTVITFDGGGSLTLDGLDISDMSDITNLEVTVISTTYEAAEALPSGEIITTTPIPASSNPVFLYGNGPVQGSQDNIQVGPYYNELDNYFSNSLLANYSVSGNNVTSKSVSGVLEYDIAPGVTVDQYGTISVTAEASTPVLVELTVTATDQDGNTATTTELFGFLDAPTTVVAAGEGGTGSPTSLTNIISGGASSIIAGENTVNRSIQSSQDQTIVEGSNLIVTGEGSKVYGDNINVDLTSSGTGGNSLTNSSQSLDQQGAITGNTFTFAANAIDINAKDVNTSTQNTQNTIYGVAQNFTIMAQGGSNDSLTISSGLSAGITLNDSAQFSGTQTNNQQINFGTQTIYGSGTLVGDIQTLSISALAGSNDAVVDTSSSATPVSSLNDSSQIEYNTFTFSPVNITVEGDVTGQNTVIYDNIETLSITVDPSYSKVMGSDLTISTSATFSNNHFIFEDDTLIGGAGNTTFYADPNLNANASPYAYTGFINPLMVSIVTVGSENYLVTTTTDGNLNSIQWGNDIFTGGAGTNSYNFTLFDNSNGEVVASNNLQQLLSSTLPTGTVTFPTGSAEAYAVFAGNDTIKNFTIGKDTLTLNLEPALYNQMVHSNGTVNAAALDQTAVFINSGGNTTIAFLGVVEVNGVSELGITGELTLDGVTITSFEGLGSSLVIQEVSTPAYVAPTLNASVAFDPVFIDVSQPIAFAGFINTTTVNPLSLTYGTTNPTTLPEGITLEADGTLDTSSVTAPVVATLTVTATDGITTLDLPTVNVFVSNASFIDEDKTSTVINGSTTILNAPAAYEVTAGTVYGSGGGAAGLTLSNSSVATTATSYGSNLIDDTGTTTHDIYGNVASITDTLDTTALDSSTPLDYTFNANLMNIYSGSSDFIYGNAQSFTIDAPVAGDTTSATFTFGTVVNGSLVGNTVFGTGSVFGNFQTLTLNGTAGSGTITSNTFDFGGNTLTSGAYVSESNGSNPLTGNTSETTNLYANIENLVLTTTGSVTNQITGNTFIFGNDTLTGIGSTNFYSQLVNFGNSEDSELYGSKNFYDGVAVTTTMNAEGEEIMTIADGNNNEITFGAVTDTGGTGTNTYNFTIVGNTASTPQAVMEGFDTVTNYNINTDKLAFSLAYPVYAALVGSNSGPLTAAELFNTTNGITITQTATYATLDFAGGGSITLDGYGTDSNYTPQTLEAALISHNSISVSVADPITAVSSPVSPVLVLGQTMNLGEWASIINTGHFVSASFDGITTNSDGSVTYSNPNAGIIDTTVNQITVTDASGTTVTTNTSSSNPIQIIALDAPVTDQATGTETGSTAAGVFIGYGNEIIGGGADINDAAISGTTETPTSTTYGDKLIYNNATEGTGTVTGDVQNITFEAQGTTENVDTDPSTVINTTTSVSSNLVDFSETWIFSNVGSTTTGNAQTITLDAVGGTNVYSASSTPLSDVENVNGNTIESAGNTITSSGDAFGMAQSVNLSATDGFYSGAANSTDTASVSNNMITGGGNTITGNAESSENLYGDVQSVSLTINSPTQGETSTFTAAVGSGSVNEGNSLIENNTFTFQGNNLVGGDLDSSLFAGIANLVMSNNEQAINNINPSTTSAITGNHFVFGSSTETATGGVTEFYGDVNNLSQTNFGQNGVTVTDIANGTPTPYVQVTDTAGSSGDSATVHGNTIQFGNDVMNASSTGVNIFNIDLLATSNTNSTTGNAYVVAEGNTTINNFNGGGTNVLNLQLSQALYNDISQANGGATTITAAMLNTYLDNNNGGVNEVNGNTVISFGDASGDNLGSITLVGVQASSLSDLGSNLAITANGTMFIETTPTSNNANVTVSGDQISSFTQNVQVSEVSSSGVILDNSGTVTLNMDSALFKALGLSASNTNAQNLQILEHDATTGVGGVAVSTTTTNGVTNTVLTFESSSHIYGSVTLDNFNPLDPLSNHIIIKAH